MHNETAFVLTIMVLCYALVSGLVRRWYLAPALILLAFGMILGRFGFRVLDVGERTDGFTVLAELALTVILFNQASMLDVRALVGQRRVPLRLIGIGIPTSIILGTLAAVLLQPGLPLWEAVCLAAIVAPTEAALIPRQVSVFTHSDPPGGIPASPVRNIGLKNWERCGLPLNSLCGPPTIRMPGTL
jgi:sodium/hydrogen antiporter